MNFKAYLTKSGRKAAQYRLCMKMTWILIKWNGKRCKSSGFPH